MSLKTVYLQRMLSINGRNSLKGRKLYDRFTSISDDTILSYMILPDVDAAKYTDPKIKDDVLSETLLKQFDPNVIFIEGGLFVNNKGWWKIPKNILEKYVRSGAVIIIADVEVNELRENKEHYIDAGSLFEAFVSYGENDSRDPVYGADETHFWKGARQILCKPNKMILSEWLEPIYDDIPEILVGLPAKLASWKEILASGNEGSTGILHNDVWIDQYDCCPFASVAQIGIGYIVFIAGSVSSDVWLEGCPHNTKWLTKIAQFLVNESLEEKNRRRSHIKSPYLLFLSHRSVNKDVVKQVAKRIKDLGVGIWFDEEKLIPSMSLISEINNGLEQMTHFVIFWSKDCIGAPWVEKELNSAISKLIENKLPILIVRLDDTQIPTIISDLFRIEAGGLSGIEIGDAIVTPIERLEKHKALKSKL